MKRLLLIGFAMVAGAGLSGCLQSRIHLSETFGEVTRADLVAQIADPDAQYGPQPPAVGARVILAQKRYRTGTTIPPVSEASSIGAGDMDSGAPPAAGGAGVGASAGGQ